VSDVYFRYVDQLEGDEYSSSPVIRLMTYNVLSHTAKGVWLHRHYQRKKFVLNSGRKRFAHPTKEEALASFIERKRRQKAIYAARHYDASQVLDDAEAMQSVGMTDPREFSQYPWSVPAPAIGIAVAPAIETGTGSTVGKSPARQGSPNDFNNFRNGVIHG
jgi:hypothetical protein